MEGSIPPPENGNRSKYLNSALMVMMKSRKVRWAGYVASMGKKRKAFGRKRERKKTSRTQQMWIRRI
jgi:hypothetical protein